MSVAAQSVYPRVCGGTIATPAVPILAKGLSPRVRGNRNRILIDTPLIKVIVPSCHV